MKDPDIHESEAQYDFKELCVERVTLTSQFLLVTPSFYVQWFKFLDIDDLFENKSQHRSFRHVFQLLSAQLVGGSRQRAR